MSLLRWLFSFFLNDNECRVQQYQVPINGCMYVLLVYSQKVTFGNSC